MILNTGSRTDIPAFFSAWLRNRLKAGFVYARSPYAPGRIYSYELDPELVDLICFCTKNPGPLLPFPPELRRFQTYWHVTITPYGRDLEPFVPPWQQVAKSFRTLSGEVGPDAVSWRYDPILLTPKYDLDFHLRTFREMAEALRGSTRTVVISFLDLYQKTVRNFPAAREVSNADQRTLCTAFTEIAAANDMEVHTCLENPSLSSCGVLTSGCMTQDLLERALGEALNVPPHGQARKGCNCLLGSDIGAYNTCGHGCVYCYANYDRRAVEENLRRHDPESPLLIGQVGPQDEIIPVNQVSWRTGQLGWFSL